jgi:hypothetical protein
LFKVIYSDNTAPTKEAALAAWLSGDDESDELRIDEMAP